MSSDEKSILTRFNLFWGKTKGILHWLKGKLWFFLLLALVYIVYLTVNPKQSITSKTTALKLKDIGELATQAGYFTSVQSIYKSRDVLGVEIPLTQSNYVYSYDGTIKAGIDFEKVEVKVDDEQFLITITLPEVQVLSVEIDQDSFVIYNENSLFTSLSLSEINASLSELKKNAEENAIKNGLLENARTNAEMLIKGFIASFYNLDTYTIVFE